VSIDESQLESTSLEEKKGKNQTMIIVDVGTDSAHGKVIQCNFKPGSVERSAND
jgi:hypothetical protein